MAAGAPSRLSHVARIARHELRDAWRSRAVVALGVVFALLAAGAAVVGAARFVADQEQRQRYQAMVGQQFADQPDRHPHRVSHYGYLVFRPRAPLGFFDSGIESYAGTSLFLEAHRQNTANFSSASQGGSSRFGELTLATVLQVFLPLFVLAIAAVSVTRERESGTLALLACQGLSWRTVLAGKLAGVLAVVSTVALPGVIVACAWLSRTAGAGWTADTLARAILLGVAHAAFLALCAAAGVLVSARHRTSRGALTVVVSLWFVLWVVVPRLLPAIADAAYPIPARAAFDAEVEARVRELGDSHNPDDPMFARLREETLRQHGVSRVEDLPFNYGGLVMQRAEQLTSNAYAEHRARLLDAYRNQARLVNAGAIVSPYLAIRSVSAALAGSDMAHQLEFEEQAEAFRYRLIQALNDLHINEVDTARDRYAQVNGAPSRQRIDASFFHRLPTFEFRPPRVAQALRSQAVALTAALIASLLLMAAFAWTARAARLG